jgi:hypothetical protein
MHPTKWQLSKCKASNVLDDSFHCSRVDLIYRAP